jgi:BirA family biotin operon repressor/biotin-[acetyl-CoA-carboxylase] ligase
MQNDWPIIHLKKTDSTNNYAHSLINNNELLDETVIVAEEQFYGRGQEGNSWESEPGKNITFTLVLFSNYVEVEKQYFLAKAVAIAILDLLKNYGIEAKIKWPNDIIVNDKKIAGVLIENSIISNTLLYSLIGIGLNVNQETFSDNVLNALSMFNVADKKFDLKDILNELLFCLKVQINKLKNNEFFSLRENYLSKLYKFNETSRFFGNGKSFSGKIIDVESNGQLVIHSEDDEVMKFMFKEVRFL